MSPLRLLAIIVILACSAAAWVVLGTALQVRSAASSGGLRGSVAANWGPALEQTHPLAFYLSPTAGDARREVPPEASEIRVRLESDPKRKGLVWFRTYRADFEGTYTVANPTPISQTFYVTFQLPGEARYDGFAMEVGERVSTKPPVDGRITEAVVLDPGESVPVRIAYQTTGLDHWRYRFEGSPRIRDFDLVMETDFDEIDFPPDSESPTERNAAAGGNGWALAWRYDDVIGAKAVAMEMPHVLNPGPVAARITFFAPVSLVFFFTVLVITAMIRGVNLHPMNYFFLAAGCFAFQLLFAYLVDLVPLHLAFVVSAAVSLALVGGYLWRAAGFRFAAVAALAQFAYMVLFSFSFFFHGLTGITITIGAVVTLAILMAFTARTDWSAVFRKSSKRAKTDAPPIPGMPGTPSTPAAGA